MVGAAVAWLATVRAAWPTTERRWSDVCLYALAVPAFFVNALTGQVGAWMAALGGAGLMLLERRPVLGGALLALLTAKPQLALLVPVALLFGRNWAALASFVATSAVLLLATFVLFGLDVWLGFLAQLSVVRAVILEDGTGNWHLFASVFVMMRHLPAPLFVSYTAQFVSATVALALVANAWRSEAPQRHRNAVLVMAVCFTTPYILVYDLVITALVPLWLFPDAAVASEWRPFRLAALVLLVMAPFLIPIIALRVGFEAGPLLLAPALVVAVQACRESAQGHPARAAPV